MNENLKLCKILRDCPKGMPLWSPFLGEVEFIYVKNDIIYVDSVGTVFSFFSDGKYDRDGECMLFPSKYQKDWSKFKILVEKSEVPVKRFSLEEFQPFDKVLLRDDDGFKWYPTFLEKILKEPSGKYSAVELINGCKWDMCIPYNEETKNLCWTTNDCPKYYKWWEK